MKKIYDEFSSRYRSNEPFDRWTRKLRNAMEKELKKCGGDIHMWEDQLRNGDGEAVEELIEQGCSEFPNERIDIAIEDAIDSLKPKGKLKTFWERYVEVQDK